MKHSESAYIVHFYFEKLTEYAEQVKKIFDEETIHLFRVNVKMLRAYLRMMRLGVANPDKLKFPKEFKKTYSLMGKIRDRQLYLKRISGNNFLKESYSLEREIEELKKEKNNFLSRKELNDIEQKIKTNLPDKENNDLMKKFFSQKINTIKEITSNEDYKDKNLHIIRKNIKDIIYITRMFNNDLKIPLAFPLWNETDLKKAENLSRLLGLFNDTCIELSFIKNINLNKAGSQGKKHLLSMRRELFAEKRKLKKEVLKEIPILLDTSE